MKVFTIYRATCLVNNKVYIGFDSCWPKRVSNHKCSSQKEDTKFYRAIRLYGFDSFVWEPIYQSLNGEHTLEVMEPYFITEYNSKDNGYNSTLGGDGTLGFTPTEEQRVRMSNAQKGTKKPHRPGIPKRKVSEKQIKYFIENVLPLSKTAEARAKQSASTLGKKKSKQHVEAMKSRWQDNLQITCPHCNKTGSFKSMMQWHMDRCKHNPNRLMDLPQTLTCEHCGYSANRGPNFYRHHGKNCKLFTTLNHVHIEDR